MDATSASNSTASFPIRILLIGPHAPAVGDLSPGTGRVVGQDANGIQVC